jgi:hypothetical protein
LWRIDKTVVDRISRFVAMSAIFDYNSARRGASPSSPNARKNNVCHYLQIALVTIGRITAVTFPQP